jgi:hypothetical protein
VDRTPGRESVREKRARVRAEANSSNGEKQGTGREISEREFSIGTGSHCRDPFSRRHSLDGYFGAADWSPSKIGDEAGDLDLRVDK